MLTPTKRGKLTSRVEYCAECDKPFTSLKSTSERTAWCSDECYERTLGRW
ncbi:hypothetical protein [Mycolicibacter icosiumassiliensis]|nr:hypothetical protein [Mycolicibacter icosiumassiliensis]